MTVLFLLGLAGYELHLQHSKDTFAITNAEETTAAAPHDQAESDARLSDPVDAEETTASAPAADDTTAEGRIDLNTANAEQLKTLPGIGDVLAERILAYREEHGKFSSIEELMNVKGIADGKFSELQDKICVGSA